MRRVEIFEDTADDCGDAFADLRDFLVAPLSDDDSGTPYEFDPNSCELISKSRLTVSLKAHL